MMSVVRRLLFVLALSLFACSSDEEGASGGGGSTSTGGGSGGGGTGGTAIATGGAAGSSQGGTAAGGSGGAAGVSGSGGSAGADAKLPLRAAFYYPWFPETWGKSTDPYTHYQPTAGLYDSSDPAVIQTHLKQLRYAHVDAGIASWWGQGSKPDGRIAKLLDASAALAKSDGGALVRWTLYVEAEGDAAPWGSPNPTVQQIESDLGYIDQSYASHEAFLRLDGKPVLFTWGDGADDCNAPQRWVAANDAYEQTSGHRFYIVMKLFQGYKSCAVQPDSWHQYGPASAYQEHLPYSAVVSAGFWLKTDAQPLLVRDPQQYEANVIKMSTASVSFELVTTFNEWGEGTAVEPAVEWASSSGFGVYLDILNQHPPAH
jgi:hypothetical protein